MNAEDRVRNFAGPGRLSVEEPTANSVRMLERRVPSIRVGLVSSFYPETPGGAEVGLRDLINGFRQLGLDYNVFSLGRVRSSDPPMVPVGSIGRIPRKVRILDPPGLAKLVAWELSRILDRNPVDVLHVNDTYCLRGVLPPAKAHGIPVILSYHNNVGITHRAFGVPRPLSTWLDAMEPAVLRAAGRCALVIADSDYTARRLWVKGLESNRVITVYVDGLIDTPSSAPPPPVRRGELRIASAGRLHGHKGFHILVGALHRMAALGVKARLTIAGTGPSRISLVRLVHRLRLRDSVHFVGPLTSDRIASLYDASDVVVVPTLTPEPFGRVAVEAMSRGRPVVASDTGGLREIVEEGVTGLLVPPGNPQALASRLVTLHRDRMLLERLGRTALERCRERFASHLIARQVIGLYERVAGARC